MKQPLIPFWMNCFELFFWGWELKQPLNPPEPSSVRADWTVFLGMKNETTPDSAPVYFWGCKWSNPWLRPPEPSSIQPNGRFIHPGHKRTVEPDSTSNYHRIQRRRTSHGGRRCNFLLLSLVAKKRRVPCVTSSSCPWQQKEKKTLPVPCVTSSSCPWQQKVNSKQGRAVQGQGKVGARQGKAGARQGRAGRPGQ